MLVFAYVLHIGGGLGGLSRTILAHDPAFLAPWGKLTPLAALSFFFVFGMGALGQPHVVSKFYMLRNPLQLRWYPALTTGALMLTLLLYFGLGLAVKAEVARGALAPLVRADDTTPQFLLLYTPVLLAGIVFAGVAAAIMGTVNALMNVGAAAITHDIPIALGRRVKHELFWGPVSTVLLTAVAATVARYSGTLVAIASIGTGLVCTLGFESLAYFKLFSVPTGVTVSGLALVLSMLVFFAVSFLTRRQAAEVDRDILLIMDL